MLLWNASRSWGYFSLSSKTPQWIFFLKSYGHIPDLGQAKRAVQPLYKSSKKLKVAPPFPPPFLAYRILYILHLTRLPGLLPCRFSFRMGGGADLEVPMHGGVTRVFDNEINSHSLVTGSG